MASGTQSLRNTGKSDKVCLPGHASARSAEGLRSVLLQDTAAHGRCPAPSNAPLPGEVLSGTTPSSSSRTKAQVLQSRLDATRRLKRHYAHHHQACLDHITDMATALQASGHKLKQQGAQERVRTEDSHEPHPQMEASQEPPAVRKSTTEDLQPLGAAVGDENPLAGKPTAPDSGIEPIGPATFSDAEDEALDAALSEQPRSPRVRASVPLQAWLSDRCTDLQAIADHERTAACAAGADADSRDACAVLCGHKRRFYIHQSAVLIGRESKSKGEVCVHHCKHIARLRLQISTSM
jgi:hypothetical protein